MILNVQGRLPAEGQVNRELAGLINYYLTAGGIFERLDKGVKYTLSPAMFKLIKEVSKKGLTEGIIPSLIGAMPALVSKASEISTFEPIADKKIVTKVVDLEGMEVVVVDLATLLNVNVKFGEVTAELRSPEVLKMLEDIVKIAKGEGKRIKVGVVSDIRGLGKEVMKEMVFDYMRDCGLSLEGSGQIIDERLILDRYSLRQTVRGISTKGVYEAVISALKPGNKPEQVTGIKVTIITDKKGWKRWRKSVSEVLWVILSPPKKGQMLSTDIGSEVAIEGQLSDWLIDFIRANYGKKAEELINRIRRNNKVILPAAPVPRKYLERMGEEKKIYRIQA